MRRTKGKMTKPPHTTKTKKTRNAKKNNAARGDRNQHPTRPKVTDARNRRHGGRKGPKPIPTRCAKRRRNKRETTARDQGLTQRTKTKRKLMKRTNETTAARQTQRQRRRTNRKQPQTQGPCWKHSGVFTDGGPLSGRGYKYLPF